MRFPPLKTIAAAATICAISSVAHAADAPQCELDRTIKFGGMNWETNLILVEVERFIMEKGYGCKTETLPTETLPALAALERGDLDVNSEIYLNATLGPWEKAKATGKVKRVGELYKGGEGWYIPRYTAERLPELKAAADLPKFKDAFTDPEEPSKGRFYSCPAGWICQVVAANLFHALKLDDSYTLYSPGTGAAQKAALMSAYKRKKDVVFYYWYPTPLMSSMDLVQLELPPYDPAMQECLTTPDCPDAKPMAYPASPVFTAVNTEFAQQAPKLIEFLSKINVPLPDMSDTLSEMEDSGDDAVGMGQWFLKHKSELWKTWVPADVAQRVQAAL